MSRVLHIGFVGTDVGLLHQQLIEAGEQIESKELQTESFGVSTKIAVIDFQSSHVDAKGHSLTQDGLVGPQTWAALANPRAPLELFIASGWRGAPSEALNGDARAAALAAIGEIGVKEDPPGSNRGPRVDIYEGEEWYGDPWCALFVSWCWSQSPSGSPFGQRASALKLYEWGRKNGRLIAPTDLVQVGDIGIILRAGGRGHVELAVSRELGGMPLSLVGGNVGNACRGTVRPREQFSHVLRPIL